MIAGGAGFIGYLGFGFEQWWHGEARELDISGQGSEVCQGFQLGFDAMVARGEGCW